MFALLVSFWKAGMRGSDRRLSSRLLSRERYLCLETLKAFRSWRCGISIISQLECDAWAITQKIPAIATASILLHQDQAAFHPRRRRK